MDIYINKQRLLLFSAIAILLLIGIFESRSTKIQEGQSIISYQVDLKKQNLKLYWKDGSGQIFGNIGNLKKWLDAKGEKLVFAMNAGMFKPDHSPQGLFIQEQRVLENLDTTSEDGNFYLKPNGVFYTTTDYQAVICKTEAFKNDNNIKYATQSGPMLVINGQIHPAFKEGSTNVHIRNGVGILPANQIIFVLSKEKINLYDFANYFKKLGCENALYLDGYVSRIYLPEKNWIQTDGELGPLIGVTEN